ncbi:MAG: hypothetical protein P4L16_04905 [Chlamydiales bacterium]|nr:hypothetical protein [Chlamydiales bacterium]
MDTQEHFFSQLQDILESKTFERLEKFRDHSLREKMSQKEEELLADLFVLQGEVGLHTQDEHAEEIFSLSAKIDTQNPEIFFRQGSAWLNFGKAHHKESCLRVACKKFEKAIFLNPRSGKSYLGLGNAHAYIAFLMHDSALFSYAEEAYVKAEHFFLDSLEQLFQLYWDWALMYFLSGKLSGEVIDYKRSVEKFQKASTCYSMSSSLFWEDYGHVLVTMATLLGSTELFLKAASHFELATQVDEKRYESFLHLGSSYHALFDMTGGDSYFISAVMAYQTASELDENDSELWIKWGQILVSSGKLDLDIEAIEESLEKFVRAEDCHPNHPMVYSGWGEALMLLGVFKEDLSILKDAEEKIIKGLELSPENADIWGCYGACLFEIGRYFQDDKYYNQAIQKFQYGLSLDNSRPGLWLGISQAHFALSEIKKEYAAAEQAVFAASRATNLRPMLPQLWVNHAGALLQLAELSNQQYYVENAIEKLDVALNLSKGLDDQLHLECMYHYGCALDFLGDFELDRLVYQRAVNVLTFVVSKEPEYFQARHSLAIALLHLGEVSDDFECFHAAVEHFKVLVHVDPEDALLWNDWGIALLDLAYLTQDTGRPEVFTSYLEDGESKLRQSVALGGAHAYYYLACLYSMKGQYELAVHFIEKAENSATLPALDDLLHDDWLASLRDTECFKQFIQKLKMKSINES